MDYGNIFVGTFGNIWRNKKLWLFGLLGTVLATIGGVIYGVVALSAMGPWFSAMSQIMQSGNSTPEFPQQLGSFFARLAGGIAILMLFGLLSYIANLVMRGATISEAALAWAGGRTDSQRGLRSGTGHMLSLFALDLLWYVPIWLIFIVAYVGGFALWGVSLGVMAGRDSASSGGAIFLGFCGLLCCLLIVGILLAAFLGVFAPLMYQSAVQGRRPLGAAISEGWRLARTHLGPMFVFWLLLLLLSAACWLVLSIVSYPLSFAWMGSWMTWLSQAGAAAQNGRNVLPPLPSMNGGLLVVAVLIQAVLSVLSASFLQTFGLTMYAGVYRRLTGGSTLPETVTPPAPPMSPAPGPVRVYEAPAAPRPISQESPSQPEAIGPGDLAAEGRPQPTPTGSTVDEVATEPAPTAPAAATDMDRVGGAQAYDLPALPSAETEPAADLGLTVADETEDENYTPPAG